MQFFKMFEVIFPFVRPKIERLRVEIYQLDFHPREPGDLVVENRALDPEEGVSNPIQAAASWVHCTGEHKGSDESVLMSMNQMPGTTLTKP